MHTEVVDTLEKIFMSSDTSNISALTDKMY